MCLGATYKNPFVTRKYVVSNKKTMIWGRVLIWVLVATKKEIPFFF